LNDVETEMTVLRLEWPPWKTFLIERDVAVAKFHKAMDEASQAKGRIDSAAGDALAVLASRNQQERSDPTG
jgi:hypothetical protein